MIPMSMAVLPVLFPDKNERGRALTVWVSSMAIGLPLGPVLGGWMLDNYWWGSIFLINVPLIALRLLRLPCSSPNRAAPLPDRRTSSASSCRRPACSP
jgi:MFS family permease